jgi:Ca-activated chloride channel family protein
MTLVGVVMRGLRTVGGRSAGAWLAVGTVLAAVLVQPTAAGAAPELAPVMLVLDASGSMNQPMSGSGTKLAAAKQAVHTLVRQTPDGARLGLAVYGAGTGNAAAEKAAGCRDVKVVHEVGPLDRSALTATVDGVQARGYTPIGTSLRVAAAALPTQGPRSIVLVSDGQDTCAPPDPCEVAKDLARQGVALRIHAIGFAVDRVASQQLACLARATGGTYFDAADAAELAGALNRATQRALRGYDPVGTPVSGTRAPAGAPRLSPGGYLDRIGPDESRFYTVDVPAGFTLYATASVILPNSGDYLVHVGRSDLADGRVCPDEATQIKSAAPVGSAVLRWQASGAGTATDNAAQPCDRPGVQLLRVQLEHVIFGEHDTASALELLIGLEPPVSGDPGPPGTAEPVVFTAPAGPAQAVVGGGSFSTATTLAGSGSYTEAVLAGEMVFYRVSLTWGQGLAYRVRLGAVDNLPSGGLLVATSWYNPARDQLGVDQVAHDGTPAKLPNAGDALRGPPVRYRNRELTATASASIAGWYYLAVFVEANGSDQPDPVPVTLDVSVDGKTATPPGYLGTRGSDPFGDRSGGSGGTDTHARSGWTARAHTAPLLIAGVPVLILLAGAVGTMFALRRRKGTAPTSG